jgi:hypothetical protein
MKQLLSVKRPAQRVHSGDIVVQLNCRNGGRNPFRFPASGKDFSDYSGRQSCTGKEKLSENLTDSERQDFFNPGGTNGDSPQDDSASYSYDALFSAPDYSVLIKGRRSAGAREYETKVKSVMKSLAVGSLRNGQVADSATFFRFGPGFSSATGDVCAVNDRAKKIVDMVTAPDNPYVALGMIAVPMIVQLMRNHEKQLDMIPEVRKEAKRRRKERRQEEDKRRTATVHIPFMRREIKIRVGLRFNPFKGTRMALWASSKPPQELVQQVFSDQKLRDALAKQGIEIVQQPPTV